MKTKEQVLANTVERCRERNIIIPTYEQMLDPTKVPQGIKDELKNIGLWDLNSRNLFRITWKNEPVEFGGGFGGVNFIELPSELTGVKARVIMLIGKWFPTGAHKVGATFGPLVEKMVQGEFDPTTQKALWPSTGNYCRGGAFDAHLLACESIAVLPEEMSQERFDWLEQVGAEIYATPGCESNVKEIYDKTKELLAENPEKIVNLNQFEQIGNAIWHYAVTGPSMEEVFNLISRDGDTFSALCLTQGSAGTLGSGEYLKEVYPRIKVAAMEALECPTLLRNGYGGHRIEGIGDKHVPWIHNLRNTDLVAGIADEDCMRVLRLFNEKAGQEELLKQGVPAEVVESLPLLGISSIANLLGCIKTAKFYEMDESDVIFTVATDSIVMYNSRLVEMTEERGEYDGCQASKDYDRCLQGLTIDAMTECGYWDRRRMHNLKYFTWIEQQGKTVEELNDQWYQKDYWTKQFHAFEKWDEAIKEFNERTGLLKKYE